MKTAININRIIPLIISIGVIFLCSANSYSQNKKRIVRVIEVDDKGEHIVKEVQTVPGNHIIIDADNDIDLNLDKSWYSIIGDDIIIDSIDNFFIHKIPPIPDFPPIPPIPTLPSFEFSDLVYEDFFDESNPDSTTDYKVYYSEKGFSKGNDLEKILEELEAGTFNPDKWSMKEVKRDEIQSISKSGKGDVIVINNASKNSLGNRLYGLSLLKQSSKKHNDKLDHYLKELYIYDDKLFDAINHQNIYSFYFDDRDSAIDHHDKRIRIVGSSKNTPSWFELYSDDEIVGEKERKRIIQISNEEKVVFEYTKPSIEEFKLLDKLGYTQENKDNSLRFSSFLLIPKNEKDKYAIQFRSRENGAVKYTIINSEGKTIKKDEYNYSSKEIEKKIELEELSEGTYFIIVQFNGKSITYKLKVNKKHN